MNIVQIFKRLHTKRASIKDAYLVASLPGIRQHKLGISEFGKPMFFIQCEPPASTNLMDVKLESITVAFNRNCKLYTNKTQYKSGTYSIVSLETDSIELQGYFLEAVYLVVKSLPTIAKQKDIKFELTKLIDLFSKLSKPPQRTIQGLWGELLVIEQSQNPEYLIMAWHKSPGDIYDFNDGIDKIEVKTTTQNHRIHAFSLNQLIPNKNSKLVIGSIITTETGLGKTVFDLVDLIKKKVSNSFTLVRFNEIISETLGRDFEKAFNVHFDYNLASDTLSFYDPAVIPKIGKNSVPSQVTNVHFESDLSDVAPLKMPNHTSNLHKCLF